MFKVGKRHSGRDDSEIPRSRAQVPLLDPRASVKPRDLVLSELDSADPFENPIIALINAPWSDPVTETPSLVVLLLATGAELLARTQAMSGAALAASVAAVPSVVTQTHLGQILAARLVAVVVALLLAFEAGRAFRAFVLLVALAIALSMSLTGHAADWGDVTLSVGVDWVHAVAASAWTGGLIALAFAAGRRGAGWSRESLATVAPRFSRLAGLCLLAIVVTGGYNAWAQLGGLSRLWSTAYGRVLIVKLLIVAVLVWLGAVNRYAHLPRLAPAQAVRGVGARAFQHVTPRPLRSQPRHAVSAGGVAACRVRHDRSARRPRRVRVHGRPGRSHAGAPRPVRAQADDARRTGRATRWGRTAVGHRDAAARGRRTRTSGLRQARVRDVSRDPRHAVLGADPTGA